MCVFLSFFPPFRFPLSWIPAVGGARSPKEERKFLSAPRQQLERNVHHVCVEWDCVRGVILLSRVQADLGEIYSIRTEALKKIKSRIQSGEVQFGSQHIDILIV